MTRRNHEAIASAIRAVITRPDVPIETRDPVAVAEAIAVEIAEVFRRDNGRFDHVRFYAACGVDP